MNADTSLPGLGRIIHGRRKTSHRWQAGVVTSDEGPNGEPGKRIAHIWARSGQAEFVLVFDAGAHGELWQWPPRGAK